MLRVLRRNALGWILSWLVLWWLWMLLVGEWDAQEWVAAGCAATLGATLGRVAWRLGGRPVRVPAEWVARVWTVPLMVLVDFGIVAWALVLSLARRRPVRGEFRARPFPATGGDPTSAGIRVWATLMATYSPNAYVLDIDAEEGTVLLHDLIPYRRSEEPA